LDTLLALNAGKTIKKIASGVEKTRSFRWQIKFKKQVYAE